VSARTILGTLLLAAFGVAGMKAAPAEANTGAVNSMDARATQPDGTTALHLAVQADREDKVAALLAAGANPNAFNRYGITPLWLAATNGSTPVIRLLLKAGANPAAQLPNGETALMAAAHTGRPEPVKLLLEAGSNPNTRETSEGETALMWAAAENHGEAIRTLIHGGADPNLHAKALDLPPMDWAQVGMVSTILPRGGFTALMYAARQDAKDAARALAESGTDLNAQDPDGTTALEFAIINQHYDLAALLLEKGADPNVADSTGMTAVYAAVDMIGFRSDIGRPARALPDKLGVMDVLRLALEHGGNPNAQLRKPILGRHHGFGDAALGDGATPLMRAAKSTDLDAMRLLIKAGADASLGMKNGSNPVLLLAGTRVGPGSSADKVVESLRLLVEHGANVNAANQRGERALHLAARQGSNALVRTLVELGANLNATDSSGKTALDVVTQPGPTARPETAAILRELAAQPVTR
jgi:uncharacterized protein